ncbi:MAG: ATP-binding cassette domain-containing protein, partial [Candidatus Eremiobacteraeota bacterium]|nr:ATP-binding cassette domain-containing protein [Candidatus Eremiobacteraeota bacterium]
MRAPEPAFFELRNVRCAFGGLVAVDDLSFALEQNSIVALIGPNGAGKSTVFNLITGIYRATSGTVSFGGRSLAKLGTHQIAALGIARTFQNIRLFAFMSALDNVMTGRHARMQASLADSLLHT